MKKIKNVFFLFSLLIILLTVFSPFKSSASYSFPDNIDTLQERMNLQTVLNQVLVPSPNLVVDGVLGRKSIQAIQIFQELKGLVSDGKPGPITRQALEVAQVTLISGCRPGDLFNSTTGQSCVVNQTPPPAPLVYTPELNIETLEGEVTPPVQTSTNSSSLSIGLTSPANGTTLSSNTVSLNFTTTGNPTSCWYDLGGLRVEDGSIGDTNDPAYQYQLPGCQSKTITLPNRDYVLNLWTKDIQNNTNFDSTWFNVLVVQPRVTTPTSNPTGGTYSSPQTVSLTTTTSGASIYYTTNGTTPTTSSTLYSSPISISSTTTLKAIAVKSGMTTSSIMTQTYTINVTTNTIYIDPSYSGTENGSIDNPYNSWTDITFQNNMTYLQKRGTTYTSSAGIIISSKTNVTIGSYGSGDLPIFSYTGGGYAFRVDVSNNCTVEDFEVNGNGGAHSLIYFSGTTSSYSQNNTAENLILHNAHNTNNAGFGVYAWYNNNLKLLNIEIYNIALDGMFIQDITNVEIGYSNIYDVNRRYFLNQNETYSSGDGIQLVGYYNGFHIHHTTIDRTNGALNKYNLIFNSAPGKSDNASGILEYNTFINSAGIYSAVLIERGNGIITRYNTFKGASRGLRLGGVYTTNNLIHNNVFYNSTFGVVIGYTYSGTGTPSSGPCVGTKIYNNAFYNTGRHISVDQTSVEARNNIHYRTNTTDVALHNYGGGSWTLTNNLYGDVATAGTPGTGSNAVIGNPLFVNASAYDFHLQSNSPAINTGTDVNIDEDFEGNDIYQGSAPDIGAYESSTVLGVSTFNFTQKLELGSKSNEVKELQKILIAKGYLKGLPDGIFGNYTFEALKVYQKANGLEVDGIVGNRTRAALNK